MKGVKTGGRKKGTPNKRSLEIEAICEKLDCNPFEILLLFAKGDAKALGYMGATPGAPAPTIAQDIRAKAAAEASKYLYSQKKAVELSTGDEGIKIVIEDYTRRDRA